MITWIVLRAAGIGAYLMLFATTAWGLAGTTSVVGKRVAKPTAIAIHQFMSTVALVLLGVHLGGLLLDRFVPFGFLDVLVPMHSAFRPVAVALGVLAMYAAVVVLASSWLRKRVGTKWWRRLHLLAVPAFTLAMIHGAFAGTDTARPWMWWTYLATGGIVVFLVLARGMTAGVRAVRAHQVPATATAPIQRPKREVAASLAPATLPPATLPPISVSPASLAPVSLAPASTGGAVPPRAAVIRLELRVVLDDHGALKLAGAGNAQPGGADPADGHGEPRSNGHRPAAPLSR